MSSAPLQTPRVGSSPSSSSQQYPSLLQHRSPIAAPPHPHAAERCVHSPLPPPHPLLFLCWVPYDPAPGPGQILFSSTGLGYDPFFSYANTEAPQEPRRGDVGERRDESARTVRGFSTFSVGPSPQPLSCLRSLRGLALFGSLPNHRPAAVRDVWRNM